MRPSLVICVALALPALLMEPDGLAAGASGAPRLAVCLAPAAPGAAPEGLDEPAIRTALAIEARKAGVTLLPCGGAAPAGGSTVHLAVAAAPAARVAVSRPNGAPERLDLVPVPPLDRAPELARVALAGARPAPTLSLDAATEPTPPPAAPGGWRVGVEVSLGARLELGVGRHHDRSLGPEVEVGVTLGERLALGVQAAWVPRRWSDSAASLGAASAAAVGRYAVPLGPVALRPGVGVGAEWRWLEWRAAGAGAGVSDRSVATLVFADVEVLWRALGWLRVSGVVSARAYPTGQVWSVDGEPGWDPSRFAVGLALRAGGAW